MTVHDLMGIGCSKQNCMSPVQTDGNIKSGNRALKVLKEGSETHTPSQVKEEILEKKQTENDEEELDLSDKDVFYKFVILHAESDTNEALRLQGLLQNAFHIRPGIIFADMPAGRQRLQNLEDAVNGSAWTIILLTENFLRETWCEFQAYASLMNSVNKQHKYNSVIPVRPAANWLPRDRTPLALQAICALEEGKPAFAKQVEKTFQESLYKKQQAIWKKEQELANQHQQNP
ncbi:TIR domain-containing adapter molecule 2 [Microcaecilia unicolor]|uniref:TIR domain-containing adapter molecule 2 n=1 Tax=Microcaecilia unicolor TaxID=1415580 RepID=A0A6P7XA38_9AMPH|nr:TIR domain-containing adapter molecule 2 [Microcaecilia unicolor]XP_030049364.1 TIR domain-containing adapter molecule 2 [Microcaecilia unicolor]